MGEAADHTSEQVLFGGANATIKQYRSKCSLKRPVQSSVLLPALKTLCRYTGATSHSNAQRLEFTICFCNSCRYATVLRFWSWRIQNYKTSLYTTCVVSIKCMSRQKRQVSAINITAWCLQLHCVSLSFLCSLSVLHFLCHWSRSAISYFHWYTEKVVYCFSITS